MPAAEQQSTALNAQEKQWILEQRLTRLTDNQEVLIYPMGAERFLSDALFTSLPERYPILNDVKDKNVLIVPGYGTSSFLFAQAGAKSVTAYDKDPVTIAWMKSFKKYYYYRQNDSYPCIGELLSALTCWYPPLIKLPFGSIRHKLLWLLYPKALRRAYIYYMLSLVQEAIHSKAKGKFELENTISFHATEIDLSSKVNQVSTYDTAFVPYLLGVTNGIETTKDIIEFIKHLLSFVPKGRIIIVPSRNTKEFYIAGQSYFTTTGYDSITAIPQLVKYLHCEDKNWFKTQGLAVFENME